MNENLLMINGKRGNVARAIEEIFWQCFNDCAMVKGGKVANLEMLEKHFASLAILYGQVSGNENLYKNGFVVAIAKREGLEIPTDAPPGRARVGGAPFIEERGL